MHDGCSGEFKSGQEIQQKLHSMGFQDQFMPMPMLIDCEKCGESFDMETFEDECPKCHMLYVVTPCHAFDAANVKAAGVKDSGEG
ncbi:MAG: hypothetical protein HQL32_07705 [Planctomycetes bacterium]|nr:hypothetical protein [Planctomycetota bacterium]